MITLSRPINWAYYYYGWRNSGLSFLAFYERVFEQAYPPISKAEVIAGFMLYHDSDQPRPHSKPARHFRQIWESSAAPDSNTVRIIILPNAQRRSRWLKILPNGCLRNPFCLFALNRTVLFRAPWIFFALRRNHGNRFFRQTGDNGCLSC